MSTDAEPYRIPLEAVQSSNLSAYGFDAGTLTLAVQFQNGRIFHYVNCPLEIALEFGAAESKGKFYAANIRSKLSGACVTGPCEKCGGEGYLTDTCSECGCGVHVEKKKPALA